tara:strand:- start:1436 stop:1705 length:270 start_codon:yes stop_codon:yes gene_type:complete
MSNKQLDLSSEIRAKEHEKIGKSRFTVTLPLDLSIKLDIEREKSLHTKNDWIIMAVKEKLAKTEGNNEEDLKSEIINLRGLLNEIKEKL